MIVKVNKSYCPSLIKEMMEKYQVVTYAELYDKLSNEIEELAEESEYDLIQKKAIDKYEKYQFVQNCIDEKDAVIKREYYNLSNIVDNIKELSENNTWKEIE